MTSNADQKIVMMPLEDHEKMQDKIAEQEKKIASLQSSLLEITGKQFKEIERLKGIIHDEFMYYNRDVLHEQRLKLYEKFKSEVNL